MSRFPLALLAALLLWAGNLATAHAGDDYLVPITVGGKTYTLTVTVESTGLTVLAGSKAITVGQVVAVTPAAAVTTTLDLDAQKAQAVTIAYEDLFRYNEQHVGKTVRYVGQVVQVQENDCILCDAPSYTLRIEVTQGDYGFWDDPIWVDYAGQDRFLEDDIVTVWGVVEGLQSYTAVLGNQVTIPQITALDIQLGEIANPQPADSTATTATPATPGAPTANRDANLRSGPGTGYAVVGGVDAGEALTLVGRSAGSDWLQLADEAWIAAFLVDNPPPAADLPIVEAPATATPVAETPATETPATETPAPGAETAASTPQATPTASAEATAAAPASADASSSIVPIGLEIEAGGWRFKVSEVHKRKAVYFYGDAHVAMGRYLIVIIDATNLQSGTDYFARTIAPWVTDKPGNVFDISGTASGYARWQYGGISSIFTDVDPGNFVRIAIAVDLPDDTGEVLLSTDVGKWIELGNFAAMTSEDN